MSVSSQTASGSSKSKNWHKKIARNRGESWLKNVEAGKRDAVLNPSLIRLLRLKSGAHQDVVAKKLGLHENTYGAIERGKRRVSGETAKAIASLFGVSHSKIFKFVRHDKYVAVIVKSAV